MKIFKKLFGKKPATSNDKNMAVEQLNETLFELALHLYNDGNYGQAFNQMKIVAEQGEYRDAMFNLGVFYMRGIGVTKNAELGLEWLKKAAMKGDEKAAYNVAIAYHDGKVVSRNFTEAKKWYEKAASLGDEKARKELAFFEPGSTYRLYGMDTFANEAFEVSGVNPLTNLIEAEKVLTEYMNKAGRPSPDTSDVNPDLDVRDFFWLVKER